MWYNQAVKVEREVKGGRSASGQTTSTLSVVEEKVPCAIQPLSQNMVYGEAGKQVVADKLMTCQPFDIIMNDILTDLATGDKYRVVDVGVYALLPHLEVKLKSGVV